MIAHLRLFGVALAIVVLTLSKAPAGEDVSGVVTHVRDGDTIEVGAIVIRLQGLHAPEPDELGGKEASDFMVQLVMGQQLECKLTGERSFDRLIGSCFLNGEDIAALLIAAGFGRDCPRYSGGRYANLDRRPDMPLPDYCIP